MSRRTGNVGGFRQAVEQFVGTVLGVGIVVFVIYIINNYVLDLGG